MIEIKIDVKGLIAKGTASREFDSALKDAYKEAGLMFEGQVVSRTPVDTGKLRKSIASRVAGTRGARYGKVFTPLEYGKYVEEGQTPHMPPYWRLRRWVGRRLRVAIGISELRGKAIAKALAWRIMRAIEKGVMKTGMALKGFHMFEKTFEDRATLSTAARIFEYHIAKLTRKL